MIARLDEARYEVSSMWEDRLLYVFFKLIVVLDDLTRLFIRPLEMRCCA